MPGKRKNRSKGSKDSLPSPDEKKSKDEAAKAHSTASETDEVFQASEMAEGLEKKLEAVLKKLEELDTIESRLNQMHTTLASIEENVGRLDSEVEDLKTKSKQLGSTVNEFKESIQLTDEDISDLKFANKKLQQDVCKIQKQLLYMETYSRRKNVKFVGLLQEQVDNINGSDEDYNDARAKLEDTRAIIYKFLEHRLKIPNARERIEFQRLHRLGKPKNGTSRPIIARFLRYGDKELVMD
ncbi:myosin heavy chain, muscle-like [Montipora foliosa]|uniref:myosin heavy chain, muscle-like n=1 Tax=Montipora foliosa TaxID=591990 RepID=UPI0035F1A43D